jgi:hypothetical protein
MTTIREELMEATSLKPKKKEDDSEFISRLSGAVEDLEEDAWDKLSTEAQEFHNSVALAKKNDQDIPPFPDEEAEESSDTTKDEPAEDAEQEDGDATEDGEETMAKDKDDEDTPKKKKPAARSVANKPEKASAKGKAAAEKEKPAKTTKSKSNSAKPVKAKEKPDKKVGIISRVRQLVIKNPNIGIDDLVAKLEKDGYKGSKMAISTTKQATRDVLKMLVAAEMLDMEL